jgi:hypothetical protein
MPKYTFECSDQNRSGACQLSCVKLFDVCGKWLLNKFTEAVILFKKVANQDAQFQFFVAE